MNSKKTENVRCARNRDNATERDKMLEKDRKYEKLEQTKHTNLNELSNDYQSTLTITSSEKIEL